MSETDNAGERLGEMYRLLAMLPPATGLEMVRMYRDALAGQVRLLGDALQRQAAAESAPVAHKIAGSAAMMQDQELSQAARAVERALLAGAMQEARSLWPQVQACAEFTLESLRRRYPAAG